jgi:hypothetical protein
MMESHRPPLSVCLPRGSLTDVAGRDARIDERILRATPLCSSHDRQRPLLTQDEIRQVMSPYEQRLGDVLGRALARWQSLPVEHSVALGARSRSSIVHDYVVEAAASEFLGDPGVTVSVRRGTVVLVFCGKVAVRFKKVNGQFMRYSVGHTRRQRAIHDQQLSLEGTDVRLTWATAGYRLDITGDLAQTALIVNQGDTQQYAFDLASNLTEPVRALLPVEDDDALVIRPTTLGAQKQPEDVTAP